ncbi:MAG: hemerythrin domain-containing protein [Myxococcales bacterium]|nr:MAG: hemerythrin domain-containing protein [Myxococcales bacterium]
MTIYSELKKDHQKVLSLLDHMIASENATPQEWTAMVQQVRDELIPHSRAEEAILYNALRDRSPGQSKVLHAYGEHAQAEALLRAMQAGDALNVNWVAAAKKLRDDLAHHIAEEEGELFASARKTFSDEEARQMGYAFIQMKPRIQEQSLAGTTVDLLANLLPGQFRSDDREPVSQGGRH